MRHQAGHVAILTGLLLLGGAYPVWGQGGPYWGEIKPGPHDVGFRAEWLLDDGRTYRSVFDDGSSYGEEKAPRPLLVTIWYPASPDPAAPRMVHAEYLQIVPKDGRLAAFAVALRHYTRKVIAREVTGRELEDQDSRIAALFESTLRASTAARRNAPPARGPFPVVIYHAGHGSSYEDNAVLCEVLASHGYVVLGSAFQRGDGSGLATDTRAASIADVDALIRFAADLEQADWNHIALMGHSGGAQLALQYAGRPGSAIDAFVSLDTTEDYWGLSTDFWTFPEEVLENREHVTAPILLAAKPHAIFLLADSLARADRYYLTLPGLEHNEFISQGLMASDFDARADPGVDAPAATLPRTPTSYRGDPNVIDMYGALVASVRSFLDAELRGDSAARVALRSGFRGVPVGGPGPHVAYVPAGTTSAPPYSEAAGRPPTPRQIRPLLERVGIDRTIDILERWRGGPAPSPILERRTFATALLHDLVKAGAVAEARRLYGFFNRVHEDLILDFLSWYDVFASMGDDATAMGWLEIAEALDPTHVEVLARSRTAGK